MDVEDRIVKTIWFRIRMVELHGSKLRHLLLNTNPLQARIVAGRNVWREEKRDGRTMKVNVNCAFLEGMTRRRRQVNPSK